MLNIFNTASDIDKKNILQKKRQSKSHRPLIQPFFKRFL